MVDRFRWTNLLTISFMKPIQNWIDHLEMRKRLHNWTGTKCDFGVSKIQKHSSSKNKEHLMTKQTCVRRQVLDICHRSKWLYTFLSFVINYFEPKLIIIVLSTNLTVIISQWHIKWMTSHPQLCKMLSSVQFFCSLRRFKDTAFKFLSCDKFGNSDSIPPHDAVCQRFDRWLNSIGFELVCHSYCWIWIVFHLNVIWKLNRADNNVSNT